MSPAPGAPGVVAVLTAAGSGSRLGSGGPKALVAVAGVSLLRRAALGLLAARVERVVVTAPPEAVDTFALQVRDLEGVRVVAGSHASRQASVALGLAAALEDLPNAEVVLVHDAARPLTPPEVVTRVIEAVAAGAPAVVPGLPVTDTVKEVQPVPGREGGAAPEIVVGSPQRARLRAVQTPQGFAPALLARAHRVAASRANDESLAASDDAGLIEAMGGSVVVVPGHDHAFKVTTPLDLALAEVLASR